MVILKIVSECLTVGHIEKINGYTAFRRWSPDNRKKIQRLIGTDFETSHDHMNSIYFSYNNHILGGPNTQGTLTDFTKQGRGILLKIKSHFISIYFSIQLPYISFFMIKNEAYHQI